jgi:hypothetical protein
VTQNRNAPAIQNTAPLIKHIPPGTEFASVSITTGETREHTQTQLKAVAGNIAVKRLEIQQEETERFDPSLLAELNGTRCG